MKARVTMMQYALARNLRSSEMWKTYKITARDRCNSAPLKRKKVIKKSANSQRSRRACWPQGCKLTPLTGRGTRASPAGGLTVGGVRYTASPLRGSRARAAAPSTRYRICTTRTAIIAIRVCVFCAVFVRLHPLHMIRSLSLSLCIFLLPHVFFLPFRLCLPYIFFLLFLIAPTLLPFISPYIIVSVTVY